MRRVEKKVYEDGLSPSSINSYFRCQKLFYYQSICGLRQEDEPDNDISANDFGTWFHGIMEELYRPYLNSVITSDTIHTLHEQLPQLLSRMPHLDAIRSNRLLMTVLERYAGYLLEHDAGNAPFTIVGTEETYSTELKLPNGRNVKLKGTIDRIDRLTDGRIRVIDYKSGKSSNTYKSVEELFNIEANDHNGYALQTMMYCYFYEQKHGVCDIEPHLYSIREVASAGESTETLVHEKNEDTFSWLTVKDEFLECLATLIEEEILNPDKPFKKTDRKEREKKCTNCAFRALCDLPESY